MFSFSEIFDRAIELFKGNSIEDAIGTDFAGRLSDIGIDTSTLDATQLNDLQSLLDKAGVDLSAWSETQIGELITSVRESGSIDGLNLTQFYDKSAT